jgi:tetratricopeptide (TPR) repeat protein
MKRYVIISTVAIAAIIIFFAANLMSQDPKSRIDSFNLSINLENEKNYKKSLDVLMSHYNENKKNYLFNLRLGWLNYLNGSYDNSIKYYEIAKSINPTSIEPLFGLTYPLAIKEKWNEVKKLYEAVLLLDQKNYIANLRLGQIYLNGEDYQNAKKYLQKVFDLYPAEYEPNLSLGWTYYYSGNKEKARELFINAQMLNPNDKLAKEGLDLIK